MQLNIAIMHLWRQIMYRFSQWHAILLPAVSLIQLKAKQIKLKSRHLLNSLRNSIRSAMAG